MSAMPMERSRYNLFGVIDIEGAAGAVCKDVYIELSHAPSVQNQDGRDKPGHDDA
jgi:hypothetical protein